jgi:hypothetical protein
MKRLVTLTSLALLGTAALATDLTPGQMAAAERVYLGDAKCDMKESVSVRAIEGKPGHFELLHKKARYTLVPEETQTGAVRLEDRQAGIVWLQIPAKSMLLNAKLGQRVVDGCMHAEQVAESKNASTGGGIGIAGVAR